MKIVFLSNYYNHHQAYLSRKFYELTGGNYKFIATTSLAEDKKSFGYPELNDPFVTIYDFDNDDIREWIDTADVVICGSAPENWIENRKKQGKLIFRYSERPFKKGFQWWKYPYRFYQLHKRNSGKANIYLLCASAYTAYDYSIFGLFKDKAFKWGYFPECRRYENIDELLSQKTENEILWCGRFLDWKHPDNVLELAKRLKDEGLSFHINMIGDGEMMSELETMRDRYELSEHVTFLGSVSAEKVREYMEKTSIYLFTSDRQEGWGAVLNEAMNSGCAVVASLEAGSSPYLIKNEENGLLYRSGDLECLYSAVKRLLKNKSFRSNIGIQAYETIVNEWNSDNAAERFVHLVERLLSDENATDIYITGPCSNAGTK